MNHEPISIFIACSNDEKDLNLCKELISHLKILEDTESLKIRTEQDIEPGQEWQTGMDELIDGSDIILILMSSNYFANDDFKRQEQKVLSKKNNIIPILLRTVDYSGPLKKLVLFPKTKKAIASLDPAERDVAFSEITEEIRKICRKNRENTQSFDFPRTDQSAHADSSIEKNRPKWLSRTMSLKWGIAVIAAIGFGGAIWVKNMAANVFISNSNAQEVNDFADLDPTALQGSVTLSRVNNTTDVCVKFDGYDNGLPAEYTPYFIAWARGGDSNISMELSTDRSCRGGYILSKEAPSISLGGTLTIHDDVGLLGYVLVGSFVPEPGAGCTDVGTVSDSVIQWRSDWSRERTTDSKIHATGDYGWVCNPERFPD